MQQEDRYYQEVIQQVKMKRGKISLIFILGILLIGIASAAITCCERTTSTAWCQNVNDATQCDTTSINPATGQPYRAVSSICESTSYCKLGTCIDQTEGICMTAPQIVCSASGGFWNNQNSASLPQCQLGCCLTGNQAAFVTQVTCNRMASLYGLDVNFRADIQSELQCLQSANPGVKGACVFTKNYATTCQLTTRSDCQAMATTQQNVTFHEGLLCSAQILQTICAPSQNTQCGIDDNVYFVDTCGNLANIYDSSKINDSNYWTYIQNPSCGDGAGNKNSATCGACDYYSGSMCANKGSHSVTYGNYMCNNLDCNDYKGPFPYGGTPKHGDTWCETDNKNGANETSPGATYFRMICYNGEVTTEECGNGDSGSTRQEICAENAAARAGNCKVNIWQDCVNQTNQGSCENADLRDCTWISSWIPSMDNTSLLFFNNQTTINSSGACVPKYPPGFENNGNVTGGQICALASNACVMEVKESNLQSVEKTLGITNTSSWTCIKNCECNSTDWGTASNKICTQIGDCGVKNNYINQPGANTIAGSLSAPVKLIESKS